ncbi:MAG: choice-of-anchor tandem repeat GloVer-containing protein [Terriglobia bacterium]
MPNSVQRRDPCSGIRLWAVRGALVLLTALVPAVLATPSAHAQTYSVLHNFTGGTDGSGPEGALVLDSAGNLYGTTAGGGASGFGVVFKLSPTSTETVLHSFTGYPTDGNTPEAGLVRDAAGNLYGTTVNGGAFGDGVVFKLDPTGQETGLYSLDGGRGGGDPEAALMRDAAGDLFGTTVIGGTGDTCYAGCGVVFRLSPGGRETVMHSFGNSLTDGAGPYAGLVRDGEGNLYGSASAGGTSGYGVVFKLDPTGKETVVYNFVGYPTDGADPTAGLVPDTAGNLYGTTFSGGAFGYGAVFKLDTTGTETVLYSFTGGRDGAGPYAGLVRDPKGNLYGTATSGGASGYGVVFRLDAAGKETVLHSFDFMDGSNPHAGLVRDAAGNLYGTTVSGGLSVSGVVFKLAH